MSIKALQDLVKDDLIAVNRLICEYISSDVGLVEELSQHLVNNGGKRLRPILVLLSANACGLSDDARLLYAAAVEFFHTATLLHDDVVDESLLRRGVETANQIWGSKASILVGDYLYTQSVNLMVEAKCQGALAALVSAAKQITCGELKQLSNRHQTRMSERDYFDVIRAKTAILFSASAVVSAHYMQCAKKRIDAFQTFGLHVGNAFQIVDDALDYQAKSQTMGKNQGDDLKDGKLTLPLIYALEKANDKECQLITSSIEKGSNQYLDDILQILEKTDALSRTYQRAQEEIDYALTALSELEDSEHKTALIHYAEYALARSH